MIKPDNSQQIVINQLKSGKTKTCKELSSATGLSFATVSKTIFQLMESDIIVTEEKPFSTDKIKQTIQFFLNPKRYIAGISIQCTKIEVALYSLSHKLLSYKETPLFKGDDPLPASIGLLKKILTPEIQRSLISIGVAFPGMIEANKKYVESSTQFSEFEDRPVGEEIKLALNLEIPVFLERTALCDLTHLIITEKIQSDALLISIKSGVHAAVYIDGNILHGRNGNIGELGHLACNNGQTACVCGKKGCIETEISDIAWGRKYEKIQKTSEKLLKKRLLPLAFYDAVKQGIPEAVEILQNSIYSLYPVMENLLLLLKPQTLVFSTNLPESTSLVFSTTIQKIHEEQNISDHPELYFTTPQSTSAGAAFLGLLYLSGDSHYQV